MSVINLLRSRDLIVVDLNSLQATYGAPKLLTVLPLYFLRSTSPVPIRQHTLRVNSSAKYFPMVPDLGEILLITDLSEGSVGLNLLVAFYN